jgi:arylsulfatase
LRQKGCASPSTTRETQSALLRIGDWKGIRQDLLPRDNDSRPNLHIELYNLKEDPSETRDLSQSRPDIVAKIAKVMRDQHTPSNDFPFPALDRR